MKKNYNQSAANGNSGSNIQRTRFPEMQVYKFGNCYLHTTERRVVKNKKYLEINAKTFDVLQFLIENRGAVVTKDEILEKVWNGSFVEEGNLAVHISKLRGLLQADQSEPFIETAQGIGYRFVAPVAAVGSNEWRRILSDQSRRNEPPQNKFDFYSIAVLPLKMKPMMP